MSDPFDSASVELPDRLIIVYNADEGWAAALMDAAHKLVRPETYPCSLCAISHGAFSMRKPWRNYLEGLPLKKHFYHRQDFARAYPTDFYRVAKELSLPALLIQTGGALHILLSGKQFDALPDVDALISATDLALESFRN